MVDGGDETRRVHTLNPQTHLKSPVLSFPSISIFPFLQKSSWGKLCFYHQESDPGSPLSVVNQQLTSDHALSPPDNTTVNSHVSQLGSLYPFNSVPGHPGSSKSSLYSSDQFPSDFSLLLLPSLLFPYTYVHYPNLINNPLQFVSNWFCPVNLSSTLIPLTPSVVNEVRQVRQVSRDKVYKFVYFEDYFQNEGAYEQEGRQRNLAPRLLGGNNFQYSQGLHY